MLATSALLAGGCGGGASQNAHEPKSTSTITVLHASFPRLQSIARLTNLELLVRNTGLTTAPNVAVTIDSFNYAEKFPELADTQRPVWVIQRGPGVIPANPVRSQVVSPPGGGQTNYVNTWALGPLAPGTTRLFRWQVVPVKSGLHTVHYRVAAGLAGNAQAVDSSGAPVQGEFKVFVTKAPPPRHVDPATGKVVPGRYPVAP